MFYEMKEKTNIRNRENKYYLSTVVRLDETIDRYTEGVYEKIFIERALSKEEFLETIKMEMKRNTEPKQITLTNVTNYPDAIVRNDGRFSEVTFSFFGKNHRLMLTHRYDLQSAVSLTDAPFIIISEGTLGLISNVLEYDVRLVTSAPPEDWVHYLPIFTQQIKEANDFKSAETVVHILSDTEEFIYSSKYPDALTTIIENHFVK